MIGGSSVADISALRRQLLQAIDDNPPRNWSAAQLAAVIAIVNLERLADDVDHPVHAATRLRIL